MAMLRAGAYSKKFQNLERERVRHLKDQEKTNRGKAQLYSKQTAQRQKALEERKKAMVVAEEQRRKKALEERREAQRMAARRFRSALGRVKSSTKAQGKVIRNCSSQTAIEYYLPNKPKPKVALSQPGQSIEETAVRVALGKDVELRHQPENGYRQVNGLQQRSPSLDNVLDQMKAEVSLTQEPEPPVNHGRIIVHLPGMLSQQHHTMGKRSISDSSLNYPNPLSKPPNLSSGHLAKNKSDSSLFSQATSNMHRDSSAENVVFKTTKAQNTIVATMEDDLRISSPDSSSNESLLSNPLDLNDSLNATKSGAVFTIGGAALTGQAMHEHRLESTHTVYNTPRAKGDISNISTEQQPIYVCENDDTASIDSLEDQQTTRQSNHNIVGVHHRSDSHSTAKVLNQQHERLRGEMHTTKPEKQRPAIIGILKKTSSIVNGANNSEVKKTEQTKAKKVRFLDQLETSSPDAPINKLKVSEDEAIDTANIIELWKRVLPNGLTTHYLPNSAFTPKMKVSLSPKASSSQQPIAKPHTNGITVHIPMATTDGPPLLDLTPPNASVQLQTNSQTPHKISNVSVGLNGVMPGPVGGDYVSAVGEHGALTSIVTAPEMSQSSKQISLEKTPTDDEINVLWDQIRNALEDSQKVFVPQQVFNFRIQQRGQSGLRKETSSTGSVTCHTSTASVREDQRNHSMIQRSTSAKRYYSKAGASQKGAVQKHANLSRPTRSQTNHPTQLLARHGHGHTVTYPTATNRPLSSVQLTSTEPNVTSRANRTRKTGPTSLSLEEKRLMLSIENLNEKIREHMAKNPNVVKFQAPMSPEAPDFTPEFYPHPPPSPPRMHRIMSTHPHTRLNRHTYTVPKSRVWKSPKRVALVRAINPQGGEYSQTHSRGSAHRALFYNT